MYHLSDHSVNIHIPEGYIHFEHEPGFIENSRRKCLAFINQICPFLRIACRNISFSPETLINTADCQLEILDKEFLSHYLTTHA